MKTLAKLLALTALVTVAGACKRDKPTEPSPSMTALVAAESELAGIAGVLPTASHTDPATAPQPLLARLTRISLERLGRVGADDAKARIVAELRSAQEALRVAVESGEPEKIREAKQALDRLSARVVVAVMSPRIVGAVIHHVAHQVRALSERLDGAAADGRDVTGPRRILARVIAMLEESREQFENGNHVGALLTATSAGDRLHTAFHR